MTFIYSILSKNLTPTEGCMKKTLLGMIILSFSSIVFASEMTAAQLFESAQKLNQSNAKPIIKNDNEQVGGLIQRHPLLRHARSLFDAAEKLPTTTKLNEGKTWSCLQLSALDFQSDIFDATKTRSLSFENYGAGIVKEISYGSNEITLYANDNGELAGVNKNGDLYEGIRVTEAGDLILESSIVGLKWWKSFFISLAGSGSTYAKLIKIVQGAMVSSISNTENNGLVFDYTICPINKISDTVIR
jgi:anti-anti-sigma regulatory factor